MTYTDKQIAEALEWTDQWPDMTLYCAILASALRAAQERIKELEAGSIGKQAKTPIELWQEGHPRLMAESAEEEGR